LQFAVCLSNFGSYADPKFTVDFDVEAVAHIDRLPNGKIGVTYVDIVVLNSHLRGRNVTGSVGLAIADSSRHSCFGVMPPANLASWARLSDASSRLSRTSPATKPISWRSSGVMGSPCERLATFPTTSPRKESDSDGRWLSG